MKIICVIPARYQSSRFPGKPLAEIAGRPMLEWVYRRAKQVAEFDQVIVATDDQRIYDRVCRFGGTVEMTPDDVATGTDRVAIVAEHKETDVVINLQGDEPLIDPDVLQKLGQVFADSEVRMATPVRRIMNEQELADPNNARVVIDKNNDALYFTRAVIPYHREEDSRGVSINAGIYLKHIGIYAYRKDFLQILTGLPQGKLEEIEKLEQLRVLEHGYKIRTVHTDYHSMSVDTPDDLKMINDYITKNKINLDT